MLNAAIFFFGLAVVAMFLGAHEIAGLTSDLGQMMLVGFLVLAIISFVADQVAGHESNQI